MSQKRVAVVLASLVATLTISAGTLLLLEGGQPVTAILPPSGSTITQSSSALAALVTPQAPLNPAAWNYIIIYQSGDLAASAASLADGRVQGGTALNSNAPRPKANFHFVVNNARSRRGAPDGDLEVGSTWTNQKPGAPYDRWPDTRYYSSSPYKNAVGICFAGDLNREPISSNQHRSMVNLTRHLQDRLNIPAERVLFQWELEINAPYATQAQKDYATAFRATLR